MSNATEQLLRQGGVAEIRVGRRYTRLVPFERFYLVPLSERDHMMQFWRYALVMSAACRNGRTLMDALVKNKAGGAELEGAYKYVARQLPQWCIMVPIAVRNKKHDVWDADFWEDQQRKSADRSGTKYAPRAERHRRGKLQYLVKKLWTSPKAVASRKEQSLSYTGLAEDLLLLGRTEGPMGPPCSLCPRQMLRMMKECDFGDIDCYEYLTTIPGDDGDFKCGAELAENAADSSEIDLGALGELVVESGDGTSRVLAVDEVE